MAISWLWNVPRGFLMGTADIVPGVSGGTIALVRNGDRIRLDIPARTLDLLVSDAELDERRAEWRLPSKEKPAGSLGKYAAMATSASTGAILKW